LNRLLRQLAALLLLFLTVVLALISGCGGGGTKVYAPQPDNMFETLRVGRDSTFEVLTWNLENFAKAGNTTVEHLVAAVQGLDVDVVALQEIEDRAYFNAVVAQLDGWSGYRAGGTSTRMELAYLYRTDGPMQVDTIYEIMTGMSRPFPRPPLVLQGALDGQPTVVINNHFKCCGDGEIDGDDDYDEETRRQEACVLLENYVNQYFADHQVIILGDMNDQISDERENNVFQNFIDDSQGWRFADFDIANEGTLWSFPGWPSHIDHILVNAGLFDVLDADDSLVQVVPVHSLFSGNKYDQEISDHLPVVMRLAF
jgi:endonuclease/exonuclease/phosphatase family metal-dependent hydrolase